MDNESEAAWSSGLNRSYSEHAALMLQHYEHHRRRPEQVKCTRSGPDFRVTNTAVLHSEADDEDEVDDDGNNGGQGTWRMSSSSSDEKRPAYRRCKIEEIGSGDSAALSRGFSELNLTKQKRISRNTVENYEDGATALEIAYSPTTCSQIARTTSSVERRCRIFDEDEDEDDVNDDRFTIIDDEDDNVYRSGEKHKSVKKEDEETPDVAGAMDTSRSMTSMSTVSRRQRLNGVPLNRQISYENWARDKQRELQRRKDEARQAELKRRETEERERREREEKERRDYECFLEWVERKKREKQLKRELLEKELDLQKRIQDVEEKAKHAKDICLMRWHKKKELQLKASEKEQIKKQKKAEEEKERRLQESLKAYEKWREKAKNAPRPATQGLLPHQKAKPAFTNPTPWQSLVDNASDDSDSERQRNMANTSLKSLRSKKTSIKR